MFVQTKNASPIIASGVYYGYSAGNNVAFEAEANVGLKGGGYNNGKGDIGKYDIWTVAAYATYRHPFTNFLYAKAKIGLLFENIANNTKNEQLLNRDYGFSGGVGIGVNIKQTLTLEGELSLLEKDIYYSGLGIHIKF
jgi:hypothetical protein